MTRPPGILASPDSPVETVMPKADSFKTDIPDLRIGSYRILQPLGLGGMSSVFRAVHADSGHEVALKVLPRALAKNPTLLQRFLREARSAEKLQHPNIASIYDRGVDQGRHYLVLEFVPGGDFHDYVQRNGVLSVGEAVDVIKQTARGLDYAASLGLIHRDIKPSNILRTPSSQVKIIDLGLAIHSENEDERVTREGTTVGTVDYMSPEQARDSRATTIQSDMYSLGCTFYYLLTGSAPFAGGDITDKLSRHARSPVPDPRVLRPDVPESLARTVMRLMAKNPQARYANYGELITELDAVARTERRGAQGAALVVSVNGSGHVSVHAADTANGSRAIDPAQSTLPSLIPAISLAGLSQSGDLPVVLHDLPPSGERSAKRPSPGDSLNPFEVSGVSAGLEMDEVIEEYADYGMPSLTASPAMSRSDANWIMGWVFTGLAVVFIVIGLDQLIRYSVVAPDIVPPPASKLAAKTIVEKEGANLDVPTRGTVQKSTPRPDVSNEAGSQIGRTGVEPSNRWIEPEDRATAIPAQTYYDPTVLARFLPEWARQPIPETIPGTKVTVRRAFQYADPNVFETLRKGLDPLRGTLELAGDGPFLIDDCRIPAESRLIRARAGFRPLIRIMGSDLEAVRALPALVVLDNKTLVLDGLDFIVDVRDFTSKTQVALIQGTCCNLTIRNCSFTVINPSGSPFSLIRTTDAPGRSSRIRLERTLIRGELASTIELGGSADEVVADETVVIGGNAPVVRIERFDSANAPKIAFARGVLACRGPIIDLRGKIEPGSRPVELRALGTVFSRFQGTGISSLIASASATTKMEQVVDWRGEDNTFAGWRGLFASGAEQKILVASLADLRSTWNVSDLDSQEIVTGWLPPQDTARSNPMDFASYLFPRGVVLVRVARPKSFVMEKTVESFSTPRIPEPVALDPTKWAKPVATNPSAAVIQPVAKPAPPPTNPAPGAPIADVVPGGNDLIFATDDPKWQGDLGRFLASEIPVDARWARVRVKGTGKHPFTPVRLPNHLTLELKVEPPAAPNLEWASWIPLAGGMTHGPLIELIGGQLSVTGLRIQLETDSPITQIIRCEDSHLLLRECQWIRRGEKGVAIEPLIDFTAATTRPDFPSLAQTILGPVDADRPVLRGVGNVFITQGVAIRAELGRGLVAISQTAIASGQAAFELVPSRVSRQRFEADLWIDRCTIASERDLIRARAWLGAEGGPDRPWLISSSNSAYLNAFGRRPIENVLLNGDEESLAHTTYFWQGVNDALDVDCFLAAGDVATALAAVKGRDLVLQWINLWGPGHVRNTTGPRLSNKNPTVSLFDKLQADKVVPSDLVLDPAFHPGRPSLNVGADLAPLGVTPNKQRPRPRH